jgi:hypothetical protein
MKTALLALVAAISVFAQPKTIFMITDAEGVAGICRQAQTDPKDSEMRQLLTGEINSAVAGFFDGGATDVFVWDGHDGSATLSALTIDSRAHLVMSHERAAAMAKVGTIQPYRVKGLSQSESNTPAGTRSRPMPL